MCQQVCAAMTFGIKGIRYFTTYIALVFDLP